MENPRLEFDEGSEKSRLCQNTVHVENSEPIFKHSYPAKSWIICATLFTASIACLRYMTGPAVSTFGDLPAPQKKYTVTAFSQEDTTPWRGRALSGFEVEGCEDIVKNTRITCCSDPNKPVLGGIDVVDLHIRASPGDLPRIGDDNIGAILTTDQGNWLFLFTSAYNQGLFMDNPWAYAPMAGGYCGYGIGMNWKSSGPMWPARLGPKVDLGAWAVVDGALWFFGGDNARKKFIETPDAIRSAVTQWTSYFGDFYDGAFATGCFHRETFSDLINGVRTPCYDPRNFHCGDEDAYHGNGKGPKSA